MKHLLMGLLAFLSLESYCACANLPAAGEGIIVSDQEAAEIGLKIWMNEGGGKVLVWWDDVCQCPSMGINNYLWYQDGRPQVFVAPFLDLLDFMETRGAKIPRWLQGRPPAPWKERESFFKDAANSSRMDELRELMRSTIALQARFSADRAERALLKMLADVPEAGQEAVRHQFYRVAHSSNGFYALVDYVNFKGEGVSLKERYFDRELGRDQGWGLLQVLQGMTGQAFGPAALDEFARSAEEVLRRRVRNASAEAKDGGESRQQQETRWLPIWLRRVQTYRIGT